MLYGWAIDQGVQEKRSGSEIDHRRAGDPNRIDVATEKLTNRYGGPEIALPNHRASGGVERIDVVRFGHGNDHWTVRSALDVKRLGVNVAYNCAVKIQVTRQVSGRRRSKARIDVKAVREGLLCSCMTLTCALTGKVAPYRPAATSTKIRIGDFINPRPFFTTMRCTLVKQCAKAVVS